MNPKSANRGRNPRSFSFYLFVSVLLLVCVVILGITIVDYMYAGQNLRDNALLMQNQTESTIREDLQIVDDSLKLYDSTLNRQMEGEFAYFLEEYNRSGRDPSLMNLTAVKDRIGENTDLYIINSSGVVEHTTFEPDKNLDFKTIPYFYSYLTEVRKSDGFFPDRVVIEPATGILRKYAYTPTPDHRFVFELGFSGKELELARSALRYQERIQSLTSLNQFVEGVRIFTSRKQWEGAPGFTADEQLSKILDSVIQARSTQTFDYPDAGRRVTYMFVDLWDQRYGSDGSKVVEITYDTTLIQHALNDLIIFHVVIATGVLGVISLIALFIARLITLPVREMVDDIDIIAAGDLDHTIVRSGKGNTVSSISKMRFSRYILMYMIIIIGITVAGLTAIDLVNAEQTFAHDAEIFQHQTEESLNQTIHLVDSGYKIYDDSLNREMQNRFGLFFEEYNRAGKDVSRMDLEKIKTDLGGIMDLYIINESLVIEYSTYAPDLGLDFKKYTYSRDYLQKILSSQGFYPDRIVRELSTGDFRKFAYMPTPDHRYIFELGLNGEQFKDRHGKLSYESAIQTIAGRNPYITGVLPFDMNKRMVNNYSYKPNPEKMEALGQVIDARATIEIGNVTGGTTTRYLFIDLVDPDYASDVSWILEITYDSAQIDKALNQLLGFHAMVALVALALSVVGATLLSQVLTRPVKQIVSDVEKIAHGDLDHIIVPSGGNEFEVMERSINTMVKKLKGTIEELRKKEVALIESEERYRLVVESQSEYIARFLPDGARIFANDAYVRFFGIHHTAQDIPSPRPLSLPDEMDSFRMHLLALSPDRPSRTIENSLPLPSGDSCWQQWNLRAFF
ncbi:MAG: methyl-accepting chemotaxis protein, partial [Methanomicrobiales archaeon]|nr:methyl-accepting chemotaxis protein [Methanomicrobiales archaeon]